MRRNSIGSKLNVKKKINDSSCSDLLSFFCNKLKKKYNTRFAFCKGPQYSLLQSNSLLTQSHGLCCINTVKFNELISFFFITYSS